MFHAYPNNVLSAANQQRAAFSSAENPQNVAIQQAINISDYTHDSYIGVTDGATRRVKAYAIFYPLGESPRMTAHRIAAEVRARRPEMVVRRLLVPLP